MLLRRASTALLVATTTLHAYAAQNSTCTPQLAPEFGAYPGMSAPVTASAVHDDGSGRGPALYVGGDFFEAGGQPAQRIARWDGATYEPLGAGLNGRPSALASFDSGAGRVLVAAGDFTSAGGAPALRVASWNGQSWASLGAGLANFDVHCLAEFDDGAGPALYAGGSFTGAGGSVSGVSKWNGSAWSPFATGLSGFSVRALTVFDDGSGPKLYAAGYFSISGNAMLGRVARWNGASWSAVGAALGNAEVTSLASFDDGSGAGPALYAGGGFSTANGGSANRVAKWTGAQWTALGAGLNGFVEALAVFDDGTGPALHAGGQFTSAGGAAASMIARWNGQSWSALDNGLIGGGGFGGAPPPGVLTLAAFDDGHGAALYAGGAFDIASSVHAKYLARWRGGRWRQVGSGLFDSIVALATHNNGAGEQLFAGGGFSTPYSGAPHWLARFDGESWVAAGGFFNGVAMTLKSFDDGTVFGPALYAGGGFSTAGGLPASRVARWNGQAWSAVGTGLPDFVLGFTVHDDGAGSGPALYAATEPSPNPASGRVWKWNGQSWSQVGAQFNAAVRGLVSYDDGSGAGARLYACGSFTSAGGTPLVGVARWSGQAWVAVGGGLGGAAHALAVYDDPLAGEVLVVGGEFSSAGGAPASRIARWNGQTWSALGAGVNDTVLSLCVHADGSSAATELFVGGEFTLAGGAAAQRAAKWNGQSWSALGSGFVFDVAAMTSFDDGSGSPPALILGGLGGYQTGTYLAKWQGCAPQGSWASYCTAGTSSNGCAAAIGASGSPSASAASGFQLAVSGVDGQRSGLFFYGVNGRANAAWSVGSASLLCVKAPVQRMGLATSGGTFGQCDGQFSVDWSAWSAAHPGALGQPFAAGEIVNAQAWYRDPPAPKGTQLSDALEFVLAP